MQIERPEEGVYDMPVAWFFAPAGAKTIRGINAFGSGVWDRDMPALPPLLGAQPPYNSPYYGGKNVWGYDGQCLLGSADQWEYGLTQADIDAPIPAVPVCCGGDCPPFIPPVFVCAWQVTGCPTRLSLQVVAPDPATFPFPELLVPVLLTCLADCSYLGFVFSDPLTAIAQWAFTTSGIGASGGFQAFSIGDFCHWLTPPFNHFPILQTTSGPFNGPMGTALLACKILVDTYPPSPPMQTIAIAGDVVGSAVLGPTGCLIASTLVNVLVAGTAGDGATVPQITWDAKGRLLSVVPVAISAAYAPAIGGNWNGAPPTSIADAVDRLAAWIATNFPLLTPP